MKTKLGKRKVWNVGEASTLVTSLPKVWRETNDVDIYTTLEMEMNEKGWLIIKPLNEGDDIDG